LRMTSFIVINSRSGMLLFMGKVKKNTDVFKFFNDVLTINLFIFIHHDLLKIAAFL